VRRASRPAAQRASLGSPPPHSPAAVVFRSFVILPVVPLSFYHCVFLYQTRVNPEQAAYAVPQPAKPVAPHASHHTFCIPPPPSQLCVLENRKRALHFLVAPRPDGREGAPPPHPTEKTFFTRTFCHARTASPASAAEGEFPRQSDPSCRACPFPRTCLGSTGLFLPPLPLDGTLSPRPPASRSASVSHALAGNTPARRASAQRTLELRRSPSPDEAPRATRATRGPTDGLELLAANDLLPEPAMPRHPAGAPAPVPVPGLHANGKRPFSAEDYESEEAQSGELDLSQPING
jgi:hypothetical protein